MTTDTAGGRPGLLVMDAGPERAFGVGRPAMAGTGSADGVTCAMLTGPWLTGPAGTAPAGALGVLIDGASAYAVLLGRPPGRWSVSAEISLDMCARLPTDGAVLSTHARLVQAGADGGLASGTVTGGRGQVIALYRQRTRWTDAPPAFAGPGLPGMAGTAGEAGAPGAPAAPEEGWPRLPGEVPAATSGPDAPADLAGLLGARIQSADGGAIVDLPVTADLANPLGNAHGGVIFAAADLAAQAALLSVGGPTRTESVRVSYTRPVPAGPTARFEARVAHRGRSLGVVQVTVRSGNGKPAVIATVTTGRD